MAASPQRTDIDVHAFRKTLLAERARILKLNAEEKADTAMEVRDATENELASYASFDPADNADTAAILNDEEREQALESNEQEILHQIDHALDRIEEGAYGICEITGKPIPVERLRAIPWATTTVEAAEQLEL